MEAMKSLVSGLAWAWALALVLTFGLAFCIPASAGELTVMPGHSLGPVWLGAPHAKVRQLWARPYLVQRDGPYSIESWRVNQGERDYYKSAVFRRGRVVQLETDSPRFSTPHGVSTRSNLGYIRKVFGQMRVISFGMNDPDPDVAEHAVHFYDSRRRGIAFALNMGARPDVSAGARTQALIVHRKGYEFLHLTGEIVYSEP